MTLLLDTPSLAASTGHHEASAGKSTVSLAASPTPRLSEGSNREPGAWSRAEAAHTGFGAAPESSRAAANRSTSAPALRKCSSNGRRLEQATLGVADQPRHCRLWLHGDLSRIAESSGRARLVLNFHRVRPRLDRRIIEAPSGLGRRGESPVSRGLASRRQRRSKSKSPTGRAAAAHQAASPSRQPRGAAAEVPMMPRGVTRDVGATVDHLRAQRSHSQRPRRGRSTLTLAPRPCGGCCGASRAHWRTFSRVPRSILLMGRPDFCRCRALDGACASVEAHYRRVMQASEVAHFTRCAQGAPKKSTSRTAEEIEPALQGSRSPHDARRHELRGHLSSVAGTCRASRRKRSSGLPAWRLVPRAGLAAGTHGAACSSGAHGCRPSVIPAASPCRRRCSKYDEDSTSPSSRVSIHADGRVASREAPSEDAFLRGAPRKLTPRTVKPARVADATALSFMESESSTLVAALAVDAPERVGEIRAHEQRARRISLVPAATSSAPSRGDDVNRARAIVRARGKNSLSARGGRSLK